MKAIGKFLLLLVVLGALAGALVLVRRSQETRRGAAVNETAISFLPDSKAVKKGDQIISTVIVNTGTGGEGLVGIDVNVKFDRNVLKIVDVAGQNNYSGVVDMGDNGTGNLRLAMARLASGEPGGAVTIAKITFEAIADSGVSKVEMVSGNMTVVKDGQTSIWDVTTKNAAVYQVGSGATATAAPVKFPYLDTLEGFYRADGLYYLYMTKGTTLWRMKMKDGVVTQKDQLTVRQQFAEVWPEIPASQTLDTIAEFYSPDGVINLYMTKGSTLWRLKMKDGVVTQKDKLTVKQQLAEFWPEMPDDQSLDAMAEFYDPKGILNLYLTKGSTLWRLKMKLTRDANGLVTGKEIVQKDQLTVKQQFAEFWPEMPDDQSLDTLTEFYDMNGLFCLYMTKGSTLWRLKLKLITDANGLVTGKEIVVKQKITIDEQFEGINWDIVKEPVGTPVPEATATGVPAECSTGTKACITGLNRVKQCINGQWQEVENCLSQGKECVSGACVVPDTFGVTETPIPTNTATPIPTNTIVPTATETPVNSPTPTMTIVDGQWPVLNFKIAYNGVTSTSRCANNWSVQVTVAGLNESKVYTNVPVVRDESVTDRTVYKGTLALEGFRQTSNLAVFIKGRLHLQNKYGKNNQEGVYGRAGGEIALTTSAATSMWYDFSKYPLLPGDVTGATVGVPDGVVDGRDFSFVKAEAAKRSEGENMLGDLNGNCKLESQDVATMMVSLKDKMEELY